MAREIGLLEAGKRADLIVVDRDITALARDPAGVQTIRDTRVLETWFGGKRIY